MKACSGKKREILMLLVQRQPGGTLAAAGLVLLDKQQNTASE